MIVRLIRARSGVDAKGVFDSDTGSLTVLSGSKVSNDIRYTEKSKGAKTIEINRSKYVKNGIVYKDAPFKSASTAANFVTGGITNGLVAWKTEDGKALREIIKGK